MSSPSKSKKPSVEQQLAALHALRDADPLPIEELRSALAHSTNAIVAKAADIASLRQADALTPDLVAAVARFYAKPDPQCIAKLAVVRALKALDALEPDTYRGALWHIQIDPRMADPSIRRDPCARSPRWPSPSARPSRRAMRCAY